MKCAIRFAPLLQRLYWGTLGHLRCGEGGRRRPDGGGGSVGRGGGVSSEGAWKHRPASRSCTSPLYEEETFREPLKLWTPVRPSCSCARTDAHTRQTDGQTDTSCKPHRTWTYHEFFFGGVFLRWSRRSSSCRDPSWSGRPSATRSPATGSRTPVSGTRCPPRRAGGAGGEGGGV